MKKILIISPQFPPSNLAAVHRSRLFAQHLPAFGWQPVILAVEEKYYEEDLDHNLTKLLPEHLRVEKVKAMRITKPRLIGDIGLRSFFFLYRRAKRIIREEAIDFLYIPIPPFYIALLGRWLHASTKIPYGIDYIDPWVHRFPGSDKKFSRHWWSTRLAAWLEPVAVKKASLITGVAEGYYKGVLDRNPHLSHACLFGAMPYGGEELDHRMVKQLGLRPYLFTRKKDKIQLVYAGAMLPKAYGPLEAVFQAMNDEPDLFRDLELHFIGTGKTPNDPEGYNIRPLAEKYGLWQNRVFEYPRRIPYLDVLIHLENATGVFVLGSIEPHYTPSKVYQGILSGKPLLALLHEASSAGKVVSSSRAGILLGFDEHNFGETIRTSFPGVFRSYRDLLEEYDFSRVDMELFSAFSAREVTAALSRLLDNIYPHKLTKTI
jgi:hypothetical protein